MDLTYLAPFLEIINTQPMFVFNHDRNTPEQADLTQISKSTKGFDNDANQKMEIITLALSRP